MGIDRLPTLTEVVELGVAAAASATPLPAPEAPAPAPAPADAAPPAERTAWPLDASAAAALAAAAAATAAPAPAIDEAALVAQVLEALVPQLDALFEQRLGDALAPALARAAEGLIRDSRDEIGPLLRELVQDAVRRALDELR